MGDQMQPVNNNNESGSDERLALDVYPLNGYYFGTKDPILLRDETLDGRVRRLKSNYATRGLRTCVEGVMLVELFKHPHVLLLQVRNSVFKLPGGRLRSGESEVAGLKRKLSRKLSANENETDWEVGDCLGMWWRSGFETMLCPYFPPNLKMPKECIKIYLVRLPASQKFVVPKNLKLLAVPLCQIHENIKTYGPVISGIPQLLSKFTTNLINH